MSIAIMCSGGDSCGMNPAIKSFVDYSYEKGLQPYFIYEGFEGLIDNKIKKAKHKDVAGILHLGGNSSFNALKIFSQEFDISAVGIPATIDNNIYESSYTLGVDTALNVIKNALDDIRNTSSSSKRAFVVETMGRDFGYLAAVSAITSGAEICLIPELKIDYESLEKKK